MNSITQKHHFGCGVACVAYVLHAKYESILPVLGTDKASNRGFYCLELVDALHRFSHQYTWNFVTTKIYDDIFEDGTIVYLKRSKQYPAGHYLARSKNGWMDPWINFNEDHDLTRAKSGFINKLPYRPSYIIKPSSL